MKFRWDKKYLYWGVTGFAVICASLLFYFGLFHMDVLWGKIHNLFTVLMPVVWGVIIAYLLTPIVNILEKKVFFSLLEHFHVELTKKKRVLIRYLGIFISLILACLAIYSLFAMIVPSIVESIISIVNDSPRYIQNIMNWLSSILRDNEELQTTVFNFIDNYSFKVENWMNQQLLPQLRQILQQMTTGIFGAVLFVKNILIGAIISIYLMASKETYLSEGKMFIYAIFDTERANSIIKACRYTNRVFMGFISGKIIDSAIIGVLCYIITSILGTPYAVLVSVIVGVTNVIPFFGPYLGAIPSAFIILLVNPMQCLYFLIAILLLQQFDGNILGPKILGESTGLSSFMVIVAILLFGGFMGIPGMIIGVPVWAVICTGIRQLREHFLKEKHLPVEDELYMDIESIDPESHTIIKLKKEYEEKYQCNIPVIMAGGVFEYKDVKHAFELGADGVQVASRFVATYECDASEAYKQAYLHAKEEDVQIIKSPVGLPGRAVRNAFVEKTEKEKCKIQKCYQCLAKCNPAEVPYCITKALVDAVKGDVEHGLIFCGSNVGKIQEMMHVEDVIKELTGEIER